MKYTTLEKMFIFDEGIRLFPYKCKAGKWTIGVGHNIEANPIPGRNLSDLKKHGISINEALGLFNDHILDRIAIANQYSWYKALNEPRQAVILNIIYIRPAALREWLKYKPELTTALYNLKFRDAAEIMKTLKMARQLPKRFNRLIEQFASGEWHPEYKNFEVKI